MTLQDAIRRIRDCYDIYGLDEWVEWAGSELMLGRVAVLRENRRVCEEALARAREAEEACAEAERRAKEVRKAEEARAKVEEVRIEQEVREEANQRVVEARAAAQRQFMMQRRAQEESRGLEAFRKAALGRKERPEPRATGGDKGLVCIS